MLEKMQEILTKDEGGTPVFNTYAVEIGGGLWDAIYEYMWGHYLDEDYCLIYSIDGIFEDGDQKFAILRNRKDLTYYRLNFSLTEENGFQPAEELEKVAPDYKSAETPQFALEEVEAYEAEFKKSKEEKKEEEDNKEDPESEEKDPEDEDEKKKKKDKYNLEEVVEYQELLEKYSALESKIEELNVELENLKTVNNSLTEEKESLTEQLNTLNEFKLKIDREKKQELIDSFYMLSDDLKKDCVDNIDTYSLDDIEAKLSVICVRNKVSFDLDKPEEKKEVVFNLDSVDDSYDDIPAWVQRVQAVAKEKNI